VERYQLFFTGITAGTTVGVAITLVMLWRRPRSGAVPPSTMTDHLALAGSLFGAGAGLAVMLLGDTRVFAPWWDGFAAAFPGAPRTDARRWFPVIGALIVLHYVPLAFAVRRVADRRWVGRVGVWSIVAWFVIDSGSGLVLGGAFNVVLINVPAVAVGLPPFWWMSRRG
jgi:hypothetical protein